MCTNFYCYVTNYHPFNSFKQSMFISSQFLLPRVWAQFGSVFCESVTKCWSALTSHLESQLGKGRLLRSFRLLADVIFLLQRTKNFCGFQASNRLLEDKVPYTMRSSQQFLAILSISKLQLLFSLKGIRL